MESSDRAVLKRLNESGAMGVSDLASAMAVTGTAVRQRLNRLMSLGLITRDAAPAGRGRPSHKYSLTSKGRREAGSNFVDLTLALWKEVRGIKDPQVRVGLLQRIAKAMSSMYASEIQGSTTAERMESVSQVMCERDVPFHVETSAGQLPVLTAAACPYPDLAEQDRSICAVEKIMFSELLGAGVKLTDCRLDGAGCCRFETN
jgi:predicted ArsR family transcriptional regulator